MRSVKPKAQPNFQIGPLTPLASRISAPAPSCGSGVSRAVTMSCWHRTSCGSKGVPLPPEVRATGLEDAVPLSKGHAGQFHYPALNCLMKASGALLAVVPDLAVVRVFGLARVTGNNWVGADPKLQLAHYIYPYPDRTHLRRNNIVKGDALR
jgi:hypothetical protein